MERLPIEPREGWQAKAEAVGFGFHEMYGEPYWLDDVHFRFTMAEIENEIEAPTQDLHDLCLDLAAEVAESDALMARLAIPPEQFATVRESFRSGQRSLYGRFDLAYDGRGPAKLLEYNADTPTGVFEAAYFQFNWLTDQVALGRLPEAADQFNLLQESLIAAFAAFPADRIFHFAAVTASDEDRGTAAYLMDCAVQAGHRTALIDMAAIGVDAVGRFTDPQDRVIDRCFKLYPWEDMMREPFARHLPGSGTEWVEPAWKAILSNKGILPLLWERHSGHPNLLPAFFGDDPRAASLADGVRKPFFSREGENIAIVENGREIEATGGDYGAGPTIVQALTPLFEAGGQFAVLGTWVVGNAAVGLGMREDRSRITRNLSRFVPHAIVG
ncbi:glutathionylspermidine synthase family protein [Antarcticirhabdus aurantiaca]|uniref:Glutathionylspermidine synthase family protein n=1 Tax=Antarcticirhabdus aurantiaca TaxID=2606717 RepID=A0ACD4NUC8_9HYPH|nr:glutathionylspermidine synthase family protein [Antarcticirhabdus aurantiaca]WAJ30354.1 glutathionylspermidine synthase family protein [Jeongeuplla avenae]